ncbi:MAG: polyprenyl diphosphate synthase [Proteobacteria bacterium]|nr:polyprenyl diphosphate synthase [Pseudomonadota bacterium]
MVEPPRALPKHVGIIMDGNGRWARSRGLPRVAGHREGAKAVDRIVTACRKRGISFLTLFAFSSQNWVRPSLEVQALMALLGEYLKSERRTILDNGIRLVAIGDIASLPDSPRRALEALLSESSGNTGMTLCLALSYGGQEEIVAAAKTVATLVSTGALDPACIDLDTFAKHLWSAPLGAVDLLIRTSGELRISNFLLWGLAYAELYFCDVLWPDFSEEDLDAALAGFSGRNRRFGAVGK